MSQEMPIVYPVSDTIPTSNHSSNGSYGTVFIVLAVIIILSAFACFLGRLFNKRQNVATPSTHSLPTKEKHAKRNAKDGDIEFGYDKKFASAKVAATGEPTMDRTGSSGEPKMVRPNSFHEPNMNRPNSFQEPNKMRPNSFGEPAMGRPAHSFQDPYKVGSDSFHEPAIGRPDSFDQPAMRRPDSFQEPTMERPNSFNKGESQGDQMRFDAVRDNKLNFIPRTRAQRY
ncbi:hypothetical protein L2E82_13478 [Cichorium intybus]|uniref:Uncharacterized protein n=1 Tax=Cichorium intybus TaxID=13427 RepID=A0ACB9EWX2_CICIN|nr:hypothetical protein L2E82_13478 [Cichorium intybus]